jgi:predicted glycosyltransferase
MRIFIDIGHPAHVHYFRNFIKIFQEKGHSILVTARNKEVSHRLLKAYDIDYFDRGRGNNSLLGKFLYILKGDYLIYKKSRVFKPDLFFSFGSPYAAHIAKLLGKPHVAPDDTEHAKLAILSFVPITETILTPECFQKNFGPKQIRFKGFMELCYLHPNYFKPDISIYNYLKIPESAPYIIVRFISWNANHDIGQSGMLLKDKIDLVNALSKRISVFISSESELDDKLRPFQLNIPPEKIHDALYFSSLYIGEGATMASEAAMLGVPAIYTNPLSAGTLIDQEQNYGLVFPCKSFEDVLIKSEEILNLPNARQFYQLKRKRLIDENIDVTSFFVWFIENYPESKEIMKKDPNYQYKFK